MMTPGAIVFWILSWSFVLGLATWSYWMILARRRHFDPDGIGPDTPPEPARVDQPGGSP